MAVTQVTDTSLNSSLFQDTANQSTAIAVKASSTVVYYVEVDNTANAAASYTKIWNTASGSVTVGTTVPDIVIYAPASTLVKIPFMGGLTLGTATTVATVTAGGTAGTTNPSSSVIVRIAYS